MTLIATVVTAIATVGTAIGALVGIRQIREVKESMEGETLTGLYDHYHEIVSLFLERPNLKPYFYPDDQGKYLARPTDPDLLSQVDTMCELMAGVLEHALVQEERLPESSWRECWHAFIIARLQSTVLRGYFEKNNHLYVKDLQELVNRAPYQPSHPTTKKNEHEAALKM